MSEKKILLTALMKALKEREAKGSASLYEPAFYPAYIQRIKELLEMVAENTSESRVKQ